MQDPEPLPTRKIEPDYLGTLDESAPPPQAAVHDLFPGDDRYLGKGARQKRRTLWGRVEGRLDRVLEPGEHILHVAPATGNVSLLQYLGMGWLAFCYNQTALVLTDRRLLEVLLDFRAGRPEERIRSYPWCTLSRLRYRFGSLTLKPLNGKAATWNLRMRGDRKLVKQLVPRIEEQLMSGDAAGQGVPPILHCPACAAPVEAKPAQCRSCNALFRSPGLAALLSLAFPGAGLLYAGHPVLAFLDFLGEAMLFGMLALMLMSAADGIEVAAMIFTGMFLFTFAKLESLHVGHFLVRRVRTESAVRRDRWRRLVGPGGAISVLALVGALAVAGHSAAVVDRDLDFPAAGPAWVEARDPLEWEMFEDDPDLRSQWIHDDGWNVSVFAYPLGPREGMGDFRSEFRGEADVVVREDDDLPGIHQGFRIVQEFEDESGEPYAFINYFVYDSAGRDVHQLLSVVPMSESEEGDQQLRRLLEESRWIDVLPPSP